MGGLKMRFELLRNPQEPKPLQPVISRGDSYLFPAAITAGVMGLLLSIYLQNPIAGILICLTIYEVVMSFGDVKERKQQDILDDQIEIFLVELGSVASKLPFLPGMKAVSENTPQPLRGVIQDLIRKYEMGVPVDLASPNKDLKMLVELIKLKEVYGGDISTSLLRLAEKAKSTRDLRSEIKTSLKGSQFALVSQYGLMGAIMLFTLTQPLFKDVMIGSVGGKFVMVAVSAILWGSAYYSRRVVGY